MADETIPPPDDLTPDPSRSRPDPHPKQIGPYHVLESLGAGGMGEVYKAERRSPMRQTVAIKIIKLGFDSKEVIARFASERQALARMDHPNIAKVLDAGASESGRPYFVMEYVPGEPITEFADENKLAIKDRLLLFAQVCDAIAHAHTKTIIHRDIKSKNVLAWTNDGKPTVKVIDFGIAKALTGDRLTDATFNTDRGQTIGTWENMSPEQAEGSPDIDTRTDVYSLGVLLYELLTGAKPFDHETLAKAADHEIKRIIREVEPPRPSTRLSSLGEGATKIAALRQERLDALTKQLRSELEWIPLKAMRKERDRRYASVRELAEDLDNYLAGKPLLAGPESPAYRVRKFVGRHRSAVIAGTLAFVAIAFALVIVAVQKHQIRMTLDELTQEHAHVKDALAQLSQQQARTKAALAESKAHAARIAAQRGDMLAAAAAYKDAMASGHPDPLAMQVGRIRCLLSLNRQTEGRREFAQLLATHPGAEQNPQVAYVAAEMYWVYDHPKAEQAVAIALKGDIDPADRGYLKALICEDFIQCRDLLAEALRHDPYHHDALAFYCVTECALGELDTARRSTDFWMRLFPNDPAAKVIGSLAAVFQRDTDSAKRLAAEADATGVIGAPGAMATVIDILDQCLAAEAPGSQVKQDELIAKLVKMLLVTAFSPNRPSDDIDFPIPAAFAKVWPPAKAIAMEALLRSRGSVKVAVQLAEAWPTGAAYSIVGKRLVDARPDEAQLELALSYFRKAIAAPSPIDRSRFAAISAAMVELRLMQLRHRDRASVASTLLNNYAVVEKHGGLHPISGPGEDEYDLTLALGNLADRWDIVRSVAQEWLGRDPKNLEAMSLKQIAAYNLGDYGAAILASEPLLRAGRKNAVSYYEQAMQHLGHIGPPDRATSPQELRQRFANFAVLRPPTTQPATRPTATSSPTTRSSQ